eukprot:gnl/Dysnectes_brevis/107_a128_7118.p1 GENE.gnl/Dysnectes_brevis/107_a128_7118~~gnl/Dysnectes_brevis/107_a128_7118.p1  ORF type:complete len:311 (+),score=130.28 gnl/Dysnectes_brevis/107_a128_7118:101-1033(+)
MTTPADLAKSLFKACKGLGTDDAVVVNVLGSHENIHLMEIAKHFQSQTGYIMHEYLEKELSGNYEKLAVALCKPKRMYEAEICHNAIKGLGTDESGLMELLLARSPAEIEEIKATYFTMYHKHLIETLRKEFSFKSNIGRILLMVLSGGRSATVEMGRVQADADALRKAFKGIGTDEDVVFEIIANRSPAHYRLVAAAYEKTYKKSLRKVIKSEFSGKLEEAMCILHDWLIHPAQATAYLIHSAIAGIGTNDDRLVHVVATRHDVDGAEEIRQLYNAKYGKPGRDQLTKDIKGDCSGNYEKLLLRVLVKE